MVTFSDVLRVGLGGAVVSALVAISGGCAYLFGTHLAPGIEGMLYGALGVAGDIMKAILPFAIVAAARSLHLLRSIAGLALFLAVSAYSFTSEIGLYALSREASSSMEQQGRDAVETAKRQADQAAARVANFGEVRPLAAIEADLAAAQFDKLWLASRACSDATAKLSREFCARVERLKGERGTAEAYDIARNEAHNAEVAMAGFKGVTVVRSADAQSTALARLSGIAPGRVVDALAVLLALIVELGSGLGAWILFGRARGKIDAKASPEPIEATQEKIAILESKNLSKPLAVPLGLTEAVVRPVPKPVTLTVLPKPAGPEPAERPVAESTLSVKEPGPQAIGDVGLFAVAWLDRGEPGSGPAIADVESVYATWCEVRDFKALPPAVFEGQLGKFLASGGVPGIGLRGGVLQGLQLRPRENVAGVRQVAQRSGGGRGARSAVGR